MFPLPLHTWDLSCIMSDSGEDESLTDSKDYNVTNFMHRICTCGMGRMLLTLEPEEAVLETTTCFSAENKRMPYGELGSVEHSTACGCCHGFNSNLSPSDENGQKSSISPGCGCEADLVQEIVEELKKRMKGRGDTGNILRAEDALRLMRDLVARSKHQDAKLDALLSHLNVQAPPPVQEEMVADPKAQTVFEHEEYDVTGCCFRCCTCCIGKQILNLEPEEANYVTTTCCSKAAQRRPYGELGSVDDSVCCACLHSVSSALGLMSPGFGCEKDKVGEIVEELKSRMKGRGDTGNIQRQEETISLVRKDIGKLAQLESKIDAILRQNGLPVPAPPVVQQAMR